MDVEAEVGCLQARWLPDSPALLAVLCSDNTLRLLDADQHLTLRVLKLDSPRPYPRAPLTDPAPSAVDFDFAPPRLKWSIQQQKVGTELPILVLTANADCFCAFLTPERASLYEVSLEGSREGVEVSSVMVLPCKTPVVVIGLTNGFLYHSVFIDTGANKTLRPFERLQINFGMLGKTKIKSHLIFIRDFETTNRYFILHDTGLHSVTLPVAPALETFMFGHNLDEDMLRLKLALRKMESVVRDMLCTMVPGLTADNPFYGVGVIGAAQSTIALLVLLGDGTPLPMSVDPYLPHNQMKNSFSEVVYEFLQGPHCLRPPLLRLRHSPEQTASSHNIQNFLVDVVHALRESKASRHAYVADLIEFKIQNIIVNFNTQMEVTLALQAEKETLKLNAERVAERYEEEKEKFIVLQSRVERIGVGLNVPFTVAEEKANAELQKMQSRSKLLVAVLQRLQSAFQQNHLQKEINTVSRVDDTSLVLNKNEAYVIFSRLKEMSQTIAELLKQLELVKSNILKANNA